MIWFWLLAGRVQHRHASVDGTRVPGRPRRLEQFDVAATSPLTQCLTEAGQREGRTAQARARLVCYLTARTSTSRMSGVLASRSADTLASAAGI